VTTPALTPNLVVTATPPKIPASAGRPLHPVQSRLKKEIQPRVATPLTPPRATVIARPDDITRGKRLPAQAWKVAGAVTGTWQLTVNTSPFVSGVPGNSFSSPASRAAWTWRSVRSTRTRSLFAQE
jgi:hypothetical protein